MPRKYDSAPNTINQDDVGFIFQDLKLSDPRVWQAITSLRSFMAPIPFYMEIILPGVQVEGEDVLDHPCILRLPIDPYGVWKVNSVIIQDLEVVCKVKPSSGNYVADILITRNKRVSYVSIFHSDSRKIIIRNDSEYFTKIGNTNLATTEFFEDDEFRVDVIQADGTIADCWIVIRGFANIQKVSRQ